MLDFSKNWEDTDMVNVSALKPDVARKLFDGIKRHDADLYAYVSDPGLKALRRTFNNPPLLLERKRLEVVWRKIEQGGVQ